MPPGGPHVNAALLCEKVLQEGDGVLSLIRVVDRLTHAVTGEDPPEAMPPLPIDLTAVVMLKSDQARGRFRLTLRPETPAGLQLPAVEIPVHLDGEERGQNVIVRLAFVAEMEGLYWIDVLFEGELVTRVPLRVLYQPRKTAAST